MSENKFNRISLGEHPIKTDRDMLELQKTIIYYGDQILLEIDKVSTLIRTLIQNNFKDKEKVIEKEKEIINLEEVSLNKEKSLFMKPIPPMNYLKHHLENLKIRKGYKGNNEQ